MKSSYKWGIILGILILAIGAGVGFTYSRADLNPKFKLTEGKNSEAISNVVSQNGVTHIKTPESVKAIYMTSWVAGLPKRRAEIINFIDHSEINALVIDVKDYSGKISFDPQDPELAPYVEKRIRDLPEFIAQLHQKQIYVIARITVFQDPEFAKKYPKEAVQTQAGQVWKDRHGLSYVDPSSQSFRRYIVRLAKAAEKAGFDEINFDYIRFPTDGNMKDMRFPLSGNIAPSQKPTSPTANLYSGKARVMTQFYAFLHSEMKSVGIPISADLFGMVLTNKDDLNIGQVLELAAPHFDYICPMIYPSHYPPGFNQFKNPAEHPYELVKLVLNQGAQRLETIKQPRTKLRPWLQDFNLGAQYDAAKVRAQITACESVSINSWLIWDPRVRYTRAAYLSSKN
jgi:hypothetical protein